ncbi:hypothetical protein ACCS93_33520 [Rhizobium ruizarguesonis]
MPPRPGPDDVDRVELALPSINVVPTLSKALVLEFALAGAVK